MFHIKSIQKEHSTFTTQQFQTWTLKKSHFFRKIIHSVLKTFSQVSRQD